MVDVTEEEDGFDNDKDAFDEEDDDASIEEEPSSLFVFDTSRFGTSKGVFSSSSSTSFNSLLPLLRGNTFRILSGEIEKSLQTRFQFVGLTPESKRSSLAIISIERRRADRTSIRKSVSSNDKIDRRKCVSRFRLLFSKRRIFVCFFSITYCGSIDCSLKLVPPNIYDGQCWLPTVVPRNCSVRQSDYDCDGRIVNQISSIGLDFFCTCSTYQKIDRKFKNHRKIVLPTVM